MATYRKLEFQIQRSSGHGHYVISGKYRGKEIKVQTTNSEAYDWLNDDSDKAMHLRAKQYCYDAIKREYFRKKDTI